MSNRTISIDGLEREINNWSKGCWDPERKALAILDPIYAIPTDEDVDQFLEAAKIDLRSENTNTNIWDCDQYSRYLWAEAGKYASMKGFSHKWPLGIVSGFFSWVGDGRPHTCNWVYMTVGVVLIDPQELVSKSTAASSIHIVKAIIKESIRLGLV